MLGEVGISGVPDFERDSDPDLYDAIKTLNTVILEEVGTYEMGRTFGRLLAGRIVGYYNIGEEAEAYGHKWAMSYLDKYDVAYEKSIKVIGTRISVNELRG